MVLGDGGEGRYVCTVQIHQSPRQNGLLDEAERLANARLIVAAPLMLKELEHILARSRANSPDEAELRRQMALIESVARNAIENATGND